MKDLMIKEQPALLVHGTIKSRDILLFKAMERRRFKNLLLCRSPGSK